MIAGRYHIFCRCRSTLQRHIMVGHHTCVRHFIQPVRPFPKGSNFCIRIKWIFFVQSIHFVCHPGKISAGKKIEPLGDRLDTERRIQSDFCLTFFPLFSGNKDNTISRTRSVDSRSRGVFQNFHALDIRRVDTIQRVFLRTVEHIARTGIKVRIIHRETIHNIQRCLTCIYRRKTTDTHIGCTTRLGAVLGNNNPRSTPLHHLHQTGVIGRIDLFGFQRNNRSCQVALFHATITDNDHLVQLLQIFIQLNGKSRFILYRYLLLDISDKGNIQNSIIRHSHTEVTVYIGDRAIRGFIFNNISSDNRIAERVQHLSRDGNSFCLFRSGSSGCHLLIYLSQ